MNPRLVILAAAGMTTKLPFKAILLRQREELMTRLVPPIPPPHLAE
jgi:hypothetical protein